MPASIDPNLGLNYGWSIGESGWAAGMDANLKCLGAVVGLSVKDRDLATPPVSPTLVENMVLLLRREDFEDLDASRTAWQIFVRR